MARKKMTYEDRFKQLNEIVESFEQEQLSLDDSMKNYQQGIKLCNELFKELNEIQGKIVELNEGEVNNEN